MSVAVTMKKSRKWKSTATTPFIKYLSEINEHPLLSAEEERAIVERVAEGDREARDQLVRANLRLVVHLAQGFKDRGVLFDDLIAEGNLGLLHAVELFDPEANTRFATYAAYWIKQAMWNVVKQTRNTIRVPGYACTLVSRWKQAQSALHEKLGCPPTDEEVAQRLQLSSRQVELITKALLILGKTAVGDFDESQEFLETALIDDKSVSPEAGLEQEEELARLERNLQALESRDAEILRLRFGLSGESPHNLSQIGERFGLTRERVRQLEKRALDRLAQLLLE